MWLILRMMWQKPKSMFPTSTFVLETWTLVYFWYIYLNNLDQKYTKVHVSNTKVDVGNMDFGFCHIILRINHNTCRSFYCIWNSLSILNLDYQRCLTTQRQEKWTSNRRLNKDLHISSKSEDQVDNWLLLNVVISGSSFIFQLNSHESFSPVLNLMEMISNPLRNQEEPLISFFI